jgi:hypothetical protein
MVEAVLNEERYVFVCVGERRDDLEAVASVCEAEGWTYVIPERAAADHGLDGEFRCRRITLAPTDLALVGFMARIAAALAAAGIACNPIAGFHHDHLFVPAERADDAMAVLRGLQSAV